MLKAEILEAVDTERAAAVFHRDGFVCVANPMNQEQFALNRAGAERVMAEQEAEFGRDNMNRGFARHSFGSQLHMGMVRPDRPGDDPADYRRNLGKRRLYLHRRGWGLLPARREDPAPAFRSKYGHLQRSPGPRNPTGRPGTVHRHQLHHGGVHRRKRRDPIHSRHPSVPRADPLA